MYLLNIGLPKTGTTYIGSLLSQVTDCDVAKIKEPTFYGDREVFLSKSKLMQRIIVSGNGYRGGDWYRDLFSRDSAVKIDLSTQYWLSLAEIIEDLPETYKFFNVYREPKSQLTSYIQHLRRGYLPNKCLEEICSEDEDFLDYLLKMAQFNKAIVGNEKVINMDFELLKEDPYGFIEKLLTESGFDCDKFDFSSVVVNVESNAKGSPRFGFLNRLMMGGYLSTVAKVMPDCFYNYLIKLRKKLIRVNLKADSGRWEESDLQFIEKMLVDKI